jgi:cytochrome c-type biogenesis protein CcmH
MRAAALTAVAAVVLGLAVAPAALAAAPPNFPDVEAQYMCVTCNIPLPEAESDQANRERAEIRRLIAAGRSEGQIKDAMVAIYGDAVLALPPRSGFNVVAYVVPVAAVLLLVGALLFVLPRWRRRSTGAAGGAAPDDLPEADSARLDADLARFDS